MKKEWINTELLEENLAVTEEGLECESENGEEKFFWPHEHICPRCGYNFGHWFGSHNAWVNHVRTAKCGANVDRVPMPEVTMS